MKINSNLLNINIFNILNYNNIKNIQDLNDDLNNEELNDEELNDDLNNEELNDDLNNEELNDDLNDELDISWIIKHDKIEKEYGIYYYIKPIYVNVFILYIDLSLNIIYIDKDKINFINCILREDIIFFLKKKNIHNGKFYKLYSILKFNIHLEFEDILKYNFIKNYNLNNSEFITIYDSSNICDIYFSKTIKFLHNTNSLFFLMYQHKNISKNKTMKKNRNRNLNKTRKN